MNREFIFQCSWGPTFFYGGGDPTPAAVARRIRASQRLKAATRSHSAALDFRAPAPRAGRTRSTQKTRDFVERSLCGRQADPLRRVIAERHQALDRHHQMRTAFVWDERVNLVDDERLDRPQRFTRVRGQQQVQRFRCGDEDVGRLTLKSSAVGGRRVAGANRDGGRHVRIAAPVGYSRDPGEGHAKVALDVDGERFEGRHVKDAAPASVRRRRREHQAVEAPKKRRQRFTAARRREDEGRLAARDRRPAEHLRTSRRLERGGKPPAHRRVKRREWIGIRTRAHLVIL